MSVKGLDYFSLETDIKDDDKVFELKYRYATIENTEVYDHGAAYAAYGRFVDLLASIYTEGFFLHITAPTRLRLSQQLGLSISEIDEFLDTCVDIGFFDKDMWESLKVLTSKGIQDRFAIAERRRKKKIPKDLYMYVLRESELFDEIDKEAVDRNFRTTEDSIVSESAIESGDDEFDDTQNDDTDSKLDTGVPETKNTSSEHIEDDFNSKHVSMNRVHVSTSEGIYSKHVNMMFTCFNKGKERKGKRKEEKEKIFFGRHGIKVRGDPREDPNRFIECMQKPIAKGRTYCSLSGHSFSSPWLAIRDSVRDSGQASFLAKSIASNVCGGCKGCEEKQRECFALVMEGLEKFDPAIRSSPVPIVLKVLEDRGKRGGEHGKRRKKAS